MRGLNLGGRTLRRLGVERPTLDVDSLHRAAYRRAGVSRYGSWDFAEPLERLLKSYRDEAALTTLGRITVRELIVSLLDNLLRMEAERAANPDIERQRIVAPVFIIGNIWAALWFVIRLPHLARQLSKPDWPAS